MTYHYTLNDKVSNDLFVDDSSFHTRGKNIQLAETSLQGSLTEVADWRDSNLMIIHPAKTKCMMIATHQKHQLSPLQLRLSLGKTHIEQVRELRVLGVAIDDETKWQSHHNNLCKMYSETFSHFLNTDTMYMLKHASCSIVHTFHLT